MWLVPISVPCFTYKHQGYLLTDFRQTLYEQHFGYLHIFLPINLTNNANIEDVQTFSLRKN
jgi:hypothetical protein